VNQLAAEEGALAAAFAPAIARAQERTAKVFGGSIGRTPGYATGVIVSNQGDILTAAGSLLATENLRVTLADGSEHTARVVRRSNGLQAAWLKIDAATPHWFDLSQAPSAAAGDWVMAVSNAFKVADGNEPLSVNLGVVSLRTKLDARRGFQDFPYEGEVVLYDAITSNPGAAGGAVIDADGKLVGMIGKVIEAKNTNTRLNYAVPHDQLADFLAGKEPATTPAIATNAAKGDLGVRVFPLGGRKSPAYIDRVVAEVQQHVHCGFIDTSWPACPAHPHHPMGFRAGWWVAHGQRVARLGEPTPAVE
jgi:serine protease Do